jgi:hypothetical protein
MLNLKLLRSDKMKKLLFLITVLLIFAITVSTALAVPDKDTILPFQNGSVRPTYKGEPVDKVTFIHYKTGKVKVISRSPTCYSLLGVKWSKIPISYIINPTGYDTDFVTKAISTATNQWDINTRAKLFSGYVIDGFATFDDTAPDYKNEYVFGSYPDNNVIAVTSIWYTRVGRQIVDYDTLFNTYYSWADCTTTDCTSKMDLQNIATHETGHGLGLGDVYQSACSAVTMYGYSWYGDTTKRDLAQADITGLQMLYGR